MIFQKELYIIKYNLLYTIIVKYRFKGRKADKKKSMEYWKQKAYAKINLVLDVTGRRPDGYHEVRMIMQTIGLYDLIIIERQAEGITLTVRMPSGKRSSLPLGEGNIAYKAARLMTEKHNIKGGVRITLEKNIPIAAGMAGGSTDAAAVLRGMNALFSLGETTEELKKTAVKLGADVPYCIEGGTRLSEGIGEVLTPLTPVPEMILLVAKPEISVSTKYVYEHLVLDKLERHPDVDGMVKAIESGSMEGILSRMENVLESVTVKKYPVISKIKETMKEGGALNALMSGSGPTVFGIYEDMESADRTREMIKERKLADQVYITTIIRSAGEEGKKNE